ncbi:MAG: TonB-dependent siderophore receptor [Opitutales bacterium]
MHAQTTEAPPAGDDVVKLDAFTVRTTIGTYAEEHSSAGSKTPMEIKDLSSTVQVLNASFIKDLRAQSLEDLYPYVVGMTREAATALGFTLRGFSNSVDDTTLNNLQIDGLPGLASRFGSPTTANVERVEVIKGPTSVLYGLMQPGGVINIVTKRPQQTASNTLFTSVGTYAGDAGTFGQDAVFGSNVFYTGTIDSTGPVDAGKHWLYRLVANFENLHSYRQFGWIHNRSLFPSLTYRVDANTEMTASVEVTRQSRFSDSFLAIPFSMPSLHPNLGTVYQDPNSTEYDNGETYGLNFTHRFPDNWVLKVQGRHVEHGDGKLAFENQNVISVNSTGNTPPTLGDVQNSMVVRRLRHQRNLRQYSFIDANIYGEVGPEGFRQTLLFGLNGGFEMSDFLRLAFQKKPIFNVNLYDPIFTVPAFPADPVPPTSDGITHYYNYGAYFSDQIKLGRHWRMSLGLRHDRQDGNYHDNFTTPVQDRSQSEQATVPSAGLMYQPADNLSYYVSYSKSFLPPNGTTVDANGKGGFPPATAGQVEVGLKSDFLNGRFNAIVAVYDIVRKNVAEPIPNGVSPIDGAQTYQLTGQEESEGVEVSFTYQPVPNWQLQTGYAYDDVRITKTSDPTQLNAWNSNAPHHQFNFWSRYNVPDGTWKGFGAGLGVIYVGNRHGAFSNIPANWMEIPAYARVDTALYYQWKRYSFALNIGNVLDRAYLSYVASNNNVHAGDPRKLTLSLTVPF